MILENCTFIRVTDLSSPEGTILIFPDDGLYEEIERVWFKFHFPEKFREMDSNNRIYYEILFGEETNGDYYLAPFYLRVERKSRKSRSKYRVKFKSVQKKFKIQESDLKGGKLINEMSSREFYEALVTYLRENALLPVSYMHKVKNTKTTIKQVDIMEK